MLRRGKAARLMAMIAVMTGFLGVQAQAASAELTAPTGGESMLQVNFDRARPSADDIATYVVPPAALTSASPRPRSDHRRILQDHQILGTSITVEAC